MQQGNLINFILNSLLKKIITPADFHNRANAVATMLENDISGLVDSLTDFSVNTADVEFSVETENEQFSKVLKEWLDNVNSVYKGKIPSGIKSLAKEYFQERWKGASFPVLKIAKWDSVNGIILPTKLFFVDGGSIHAKDKEDTDELSLLSYDYYLGAKEEPSKKLDKNCIFAKGGRWFTKYPIPYLIKRGVYHNWRIIKDLKDKQTEILSQVIPYMLLVKKGTEQLAIKDVKGYSDPELKKTVEQLQDLMDKMNDASTTGKTKAPIRATNFDEELKHFIPDLSTIFEPKLTSGAERNILAGLGFIDVIQGISDTRRESILNPKVFVEETRQGVEDFKQILKEVVLLIKEKNKTHIKYMTADFYVSASPIKGFMSDAFKQEIRLLWKHGQLSNQTYCELVGETEYQGEIHRREKEAKGGIDEIMRPHMTDNKEGVGIDIPGEEPIEEDTDENGNPKDRDKIDDKDKFKMSKLHLEGAPYSTIKDLPDSVKKKLTPDKQKAWLSIFNSAYNFYMKKFGDAKKAESLAFRTAWSQIKQVKTRTKKK